MQSKRCHLHNGKCTEDESIYLIHLACLAFWCEEYAPVVILNVQPFLPNISKVLSFHLQMFVQNTAIKLHESTNYEDSHHYQAFFLKSIDSTGTQELYRPGKVHRGQVESPRTVSAVAIVVIKAIYHFMYGFNQQCIAFITEIAQAFNVPGITADLSRQRHISSGQLPIMVI